MSERLKKAFADANKNLKTAQDSATKLIEQEDRFVEYYNKLEDALKFQNENAIAPKQELVNELKKNFNDITETFRIFSRYNDNIGEELAVLSNITKDGGFVQKTGHILDSRSKDFKDVIRANKARKNKLKERKPRS